MEEGALRAALDAVLKKYVGAKTSQFTFKMIEDDVTRLLRRLTEVDVEDALSPVEFHIKELANNRFEVHPKNIYTALLLLGVQSPPPRTVVLDEYRWRGRHFVVNAEGYVTIYEEKRVTDEQV
jgi:hypothetical protein